jgi:Toxin SymE, type I toxin-antitoxin system
MSQTIHELDASSSTQTLPPITDTHDDSLARELLEKIDRLRLVLPVISVAPLAAPAAGDTYVNEHAQPPARDACKQSKRFKIGCTGNGRPRSDVPYLRMRGRWLERAGFVIGQRVKVDVDQGRLIVEPVD